MTSPPVPEDLSRLAGAPLAEVVPLLPRASRTTEDERLRLTAVLVDRVVDVLRGGSRKDAIDDALALETWLASPEGAELDAAAPRLWGEWKSIARVLARAGRRFDRLAMDSIRRSHPTYGDAVLRALHAAPGQSLPRQRLLQQVRASGAGAKCSDSQLSHLLRDFEAVGLVLRLSEPDRRAVTVELGPVGREVARKEFGAPSESAAAREAARQRFVEETQDLLASYRELRPEAAPVRSFVGAERGP